MAELTAILTDEWFDLPRGTVAARPLWAIGDIHGCVDQLDMLHGFLHEAVSEPGMLVYLGDYVDRGRDSPGALSKVAEGPGVDGLDVVRLRGNHDQYLIDGAGLEGGVSTATFDNWLIYGGESTFDDLGVDPAMEPDARGAALRRALGEALCDFLRSTVLRHCEGSIVFAHAGLNPAREMVEQTARDLMWVRGPFLECPAHEWELGCVVVHGHTPNAFGVDHHRIGVDSGCYDTGVLTLLEMRGRQGRFHRAVV